MGLSKNIYEGSSGLLLGASVAAVSGSIYLVYMGGSIFLEWSIISVNSSLVSMGVLVDWPSLLFLGVVALISSKILSYCGYYLSSEKDVMRFFFVLILFVGSMGLLIISPNMISILLGWDGLGLSSYALVIFYQNESSGGAGMLTVLSNRVGDVAILMSVSLMAAGGGWNFILAGDSSALVAVLVGLAAMTKSAQAPFSAWLPAAMAAPTPVSALVHSSTLVTAGVYLLFRFNDHLMASGAGGLFMWAGVITMLFSGLGANFESDMKKIVALSTLSQLGLMFMSLGLGFKYFAFFHLVAHALFKSSLFMCAGFMIHSVGGSQDSRVMSGFGLASPILGLSLSVTNLALCGFPFLAGFYSKDLILESAVSSGLSFWLLLAIVIATGLTVSYSVRLMLKGLNSVSSLGLVSGLGDFDKKVVKSVSGLLGLSGVGGCVVGGVGLPFSTPLILGYGEKLYILGVLAASALATSAWLNRGQGLSKKSLGQASHFLSGMWFLPGLSSKPGGLTAFFLGSGLGASYETGWLECYGGKGGSFIFSGLSSVLQISQKSVVAGSYFMVVFFSLILLVY